MLDKTYQPAEIEARIAKVWEDADAFKSGRPERADAQPYTIVIPPPNVTGTLHIGHALNNTLQDILCRFERCAGAMCSGSQAWITPVSRRKWWSSGRWLSEASRGAVISGAKNSSKRSGSGRKSRAA